jgi:hypothetical protein
MGAPRVIFGRSTASGPEDWPLEGPESPSAGRVRRFVLAASSVVVGLAYLRIYFGVDFADEAFHVAVPYRYVLGARPFVDEINIAQQGPGLLLYPFVWAYYHLRGLDGLILFGRHLYFLFMLGVSATLFVALRALTRSRLLALPVALLALAFLPNGVPSLNYNSLGAGFFTAGSFLGLAYLFTHRRRELVLAGLGHGLAIFSYPPLFIATAVYAVALYVGAGRTRSAVLPYLGAAAIPVFGLVTAVASGGLANAHQLLSDSANYHAGRGGGPEKALSIVRDTLGNFQLAPFALAALVGAGLLLRRGRLWTGLALLAASAVLALPARPVPPELIGGSFQYATNLGLLAVPLIGLLWRHAFARRVLFLVWLPSFVAGWTTAWTTTGAGGHSAVGFFPAAIVATLLFALALRPAYERAKSTGAPRFAVAQSIVVFVPLAMFLLLQYGSAFHDDRPPFLRSQVKSGPYAGLFTTAETKRFLTSLTSSLRPVANSDCSILFYYNFPAGYLLTDGRPATVTAWLFDREPPRKLYSRRLLAHYDANGDREPDIIVKMMRIPYGIAHGAQRTGHPRYLPGDPVDGLTHQPQYARVATTSSYEIYARRARSC